MQLLDPSLPMLKIIKPRKIILIKRMIKKQLVKKFNTPNKIEIIKMTLPKLLECNPLCNPKPLYGFGH